jgi:hypothetical protein
VEPHLTALRDGTLSVADLEHFARLFDEISDETGARYSASSFVKWLAVECSDYHNAPAGGPGTKRPVRDAA